jgi:hypothetical protein
MYDNKGNLIGIYGSIAVYRSSELWYHVRYEEHDLFGLEKETICARDEGDVHPLSSIDRLDTLARRINSSLLANLANNPSGSFLASQSTS